MTPEERKIDELFLPIALKTGTVRQDGTHTEDFEDWDSIIKSAKASLLQMLKDARVDQVMKDFLALNVYLNEVDESELIAWRDDTLALVDPKEKES